MEIGVISYLSFSKDEAYISCKSINSSSDKYHFKPSLVPFEISLHKLICIETNLTVVFSEFIPEIHAKDLALSKCKGSSKISLHHNRNIVEFLIENDIASGYRTYELEKVEGLFEINGFKSKVFINIEEMISKYEVRYSEGGRDKPGDWSTAFISINTNRQSNLSMNKLDRYLEKIFPDFNVTLARDRDDMEHRFKTDILNKLRKEIGEEKLERIKILCEDMTRNVREMALIVYNENDHARFLAEYYKELKREIINYYK